MLQSLNGNVHVDRDSFFGIADTSRTRDHSMKLHMRLYSMSSFYTIFFWIRIVNIRNFAR